LNIKAFADKGTLDIAMDVVIRDPAEFEWPPEQAGLVILPGPNDQPQRLVPTLTYGEPNSTPYPEPGRHVYARGSVADPQANRILLTISGMVAGDEAIDLPPIQFQRIRIGGLEIARCQAALVRN
jgi:hypothetical protein